jgi:membrane protease YdiL (CAAX protease family)
MKRIIFALTFICLTLVTYSQDSIPLPDSSQVTFTKVYNDVKSGVAGLASALKVGATHVYSVLVKQQLVYAITYLILTLVLLISSIICITIFTRNYKKAMRSERWEYTSLDDSFDLGGMLTISIVLSLITILVMIFNMEQIVMGFVNPEYGAIKEILDFI